MKALYEIFSSEPAIALGWTLLHSLWQSMIIWLTVLLLLRIIPGKYAALRYGLSALAMLAICSVSALTFSVLTSPAPTHQSPAATFVLHNVPAHEDAVGASPVNKLMTGIQAALPFVVGFWIIGALIFISRILGGLWYLKRLKESAVLLLEDAWSTHVKQLSRRLKISRDVLLGESHLISVPLVIGYLKPIILVPVGMLSGLSPEQVEAVLIHELSHVRRHDYLINIVQTVIESIFFFNPFVWMISGFIRREREHCCDDAVLEQHGNAKAYVHALAYLEDRKLHGNGLALALTGNENQLLNRIKRIMERSVKHYSSRERIIPALLLIVGLLCASWITIQSQDKQEEKKTQDKDGAPVSTPVAQADTTIKKNEKSATYSRKKITTIGPDGQPREEIVENFEGDEDLRPMMEDFDMHFDIPPVPDVAEFMQPFDIPHLPSFHFQLDTMIHGPMMAFGPDKDWEKFAEEFTRRFRENFGDFYQEHQEDLEKMMEGMEKDFQHKFDDEWVKKMEDRAQEMQQYWRKQSENMALEHDHMKDLEQHMKKLESHMNDWEETHGYQLEKAEEKMRSLEDNMHAFEKSLKEELVKDDYLEEGEKILNMQWDEGGSIYINGKKIKPSDEEKYKELHRKYFKNSSGNFRYTE